LSFDDRHKRSGVEQQFDTSRNDQDDGRATSAPARAVTACVDRKRRGLNADQSARRNSASLVSCHGAEPMVTVDLPRRIPPVKNELSLWRAFLADEIEAILQNGD
jgi:hypothetical protein